MTTIKRRPDFAEVYFDWSDCLSSRRGLQLGIAAAFAIAMLWAPLFGLAWDDYFDSVFKSVVLIPGFVLVMALHELLHAAMALWVSKSEKVWFQGFSRGALIVRASGLVARNRYALELLTPLVTLSVLVPAITLAIYPMIGWLIVPLAIANALTAGLDLYIAHATLTRCPVGSLVDGDGDELYFVAHKKATA